MCPSYEPFNYPHFKRAARWRPEMLIAHVPSCRKWSQVDAMDGSPNLWNGVEDMGSWIEQEIAGCRFADTRLGKRFGMLMEQRSKGPRQTLPLACGDWSATKATYRFFDNDRVSEAYILAGHFHRPLCWISSVTACSGCSS